jgi:hypothetical protein
MKTVTIREVERAPANKQSAIVTTPSEHLHYEYIRKEGHVKTWEVPPPMYNRPPRIIKGGNLIGTRRGAMVIVGYHGHNTTRDGSRWVGKCACGRYELRNGITWRKGLKKETFDACNRCKQIINKGRPK